jgi:hypothetical protein
MASLLIYVALVVALIACLAFAGHWAVGLGLGVILMLLAAMPTGKLGGSGMFDVELAPGQKPWF